MTAPTQDSASRIPRILSQRRKQYLAIVWILTLLLAGLYAFSLSFGETWYSPSEVFAVIMGHDVPGATYTVGSLRLPRATLGLLVGLALGAGGVTFQTLLGNTLASPDIIGISATASAAGALSIIILGWGQFATSLLALVVSAIVAVVIGALARIGGYSASRFILIGIGIAALAQALVTYILSQANAWDLNALTRWLRGSLQQSNWDMVTIVGVTVVFCLPLLVMGEHYGRALTLGVPVATSLGLRTNVVTLAAVVAAITLVAAATAACGPIAFVAFMAGPIALRIVGAHAPRILPSALVGAILILVADLAGQYFLGFRYPVGIVTGALGAPFLIYTLARTAKKGSFA